MEAFRPRKGDVLIWNADLVHGGGMERHPALMQKSFVCNYCPIGIRPFYFAYRRRHRTLLQHRPGCFYSSRYYELR